MFQRFEAALNAAIVSGRIAGAVALVSDRQGVTYEHAAGVRSLGTPDPMDQETLFWIASMTKAVVSVGALQLVERGALSLDADISELLPDLKELQVLEGVDADGAPRLRPARGAVTLRQLLSHSAGFGYGFTSPDLAAYAKHAGVPLIDYTRKSLRQPLLFDPGQGWLYGIGIDWAGVAIEAASGRRIDSYLAENVFGPLGMADTGFSIAGARAARTAGVHAYGPDGGLVQIPFGMPPEPELLSGGGGLYSTARDYARFLRMLIGEGQSNGVRVLSAETARSLAEIQTGERRAGHIKSADPVMSHDFDPYPQMRTGHGLATMITPEPTGDGRSAGSLAWAGLANTYYWADKAAGVAGVLLTQLMPFANPDVLSLLRTLERDAYKIS